MAKKSKSKPKHAPADDDGAPKLLGKSAAGFPSEPTITTLDRFPNPGRYPYTIKLSTEDFTSLCPVTGQPDFAKLEIEYSPDEWCVETKSLKYYLASYRNVRAFNEAVIHRIMDDLVNACQPLVMEIRAQFASRGGITLSVTAQYPGAEDPDDLGVPF